MRKLIFKYAYSICYIILDNRICNNENEEKQMENNIEFWMNRISSFYQNRCMVKKLVKKKDF